MMVEIREKTIRQFQRDGAVCLRQAFDRSWLDVLSSALDENFASPGPCSTQYTEAGKPGGFYDDYCNCCLLYTSPSPRD